MRRLLFFCLLCLPSFAYLQDRQLIYAADKTPLFSVSGNDIYSPDGTQLLYAQKGNILFTGASDEKQNIFLLATSSDIFSREKELLYEKNQSRASFAFRNGKVYRSTSDNEDISEQQQLIHIEKSKKWVAFYSSFTDSLLAYYLADSLPPFCAIFTAYTVIRQYDLLKLLDQKIKNASTLQGAYATIRPLWGNAVAGEWIWDGKILRPRWSADPRSVWAFDGQTLKQQYESNIYEQYQWDGENFKPLWRSSRTQEWSWDGRILKPTWNSDWDNQYTIEDGIVKPWSAAHPEREWVTDGTIPIPVLILIVSGIAQIF